MKSLITSLAAFCLVVGLSSDAQARNVNLDALLGELVEKHDRIKASEAQLQSVVHQHKSAKGAWLPQVSLTVEGGRESISRPSEMGTQKTRNESNLSATQLIYDFGGVSGTVDSTASQIDEFEALLLQTKQEIVSLGINAYLRVIRSRELVKYAKRSEASMVELSGMQETLVERGAGYSYEELQVKAQLAGAQSFRVTQERELQISLNNFKAVFEFVPTPLEVDRMSVVPVPSKHFPGNVEDAVGVAFNNNPLLLETTHAVSRLQGNLRTQRATFYPQFDAVLEAERKENDQGTGGVRAEQRATIQMSYDIYTGKQDTENVNSVRSEITSAKRTLLDRRRTVEEGVRNAWLELTTLRTNSELLQNQADITFEFLGLVKKKKATGEEVRLLDILVGERDYIQAISAKVVTDIDIVIAGYNLLFEMGLITKDITRQ